MVYYRIFRSVLHFESEYVLRFKSGFLYSKRIQGVVLAPKEEKA
jgi:hypothetical protein